MGHAIKAPNRPFQVRAWTAALGQYRNDRGDFVTPKGPQDKFIIDEPVFAQSRDGAYRKVLTEVIPRWIAEQGDEVLVTVEDIHFQIVDAQSNFGECVCEPGDPYDD